MNNLVVRRGARLDIREIRDWYEGEEVGLGGRFLTELENVLERVRAMPLQFPEVGRSLRRALLRGFPYSVYFLQRDDVVVIFAVLHQHRDRAAWQNRSRREIEG